MANGAYMRGLYQLATSATWGPPAGTPSENEFADPSSIAFLLVSSNADYQFDGTHNYVSSVSGWELSSTSYQANGDTGHLGRLQAKAVSSLEADGTSGVYLTASSVEWANMTDSDIIGAIVTFVSAAPDSPTFSNELLFWHGNGFPVTPNGTLTVNPNATSGLAYFQNVQT